MDGMTISSLNSYSGAAMDLVYITDYPRQGFFRHVPSDTTSADDGTMILVDASGRRYLRNYEQVTPEMFGAMGDGTTNDTANINAAAAFLKAKGGGILALRPGARYKVGQRSPGNQGPSIILGSKVCLEGNGATLIQSSNASFVGADWARTNQKTLTSDIVLGANTITVDDATGFAVGDTVFGRAGNNAWDAPLPKLFWEMRLSNALYCPSNY